MENILPIFILIPFLGFLINVIITRRDEKRLAEVTFVMLGLQFVSTLLFTAFWLYSNEPYFYKKWFTFLQFENFELYIDFIYDKSTATYLLVGSFIAFLITTYSRNYLHGEEGFKRFFTTILLFYLGYNIIVLSSNLTTIFIGWETIGISSFLLIAYYRNRYIPVKNAVKIFSLYRLGDAALILAMWLSHQIWHKNISLHYFSSSADLPEYVSKYPAYAVAFVLCIFIASAIKSAQFPFSAWLSRALEGPTPSSAIFYSSLAVHLGILGLLRTYDFWIHVPWMQELIILSGAFSFILSSITARIQPSIKGQISYSIIGQVGIIAIEVALGWHTLALVHFASHAMLRSYQLLISPSIVTYAIRKQFFEFVPVLRIELPLFIRKILNSVYILSLNEWYLDSFIYYSIWAPFKKTGTLLQKIPLQITRWFSIILVVLITLVTIANRLFIIEVNPVIGSSAIAGIALLYVLRAFAEKERLMHAWHSLARSHWFIMCAAFLNGIPIYHLALYVAGIAVSYVLGHFTMNVIRKKEDFISLHGYQGHCYEYPKSEFWFFVSSLGLMGFPITSAFIGVELIFNNVSPDQYILLALLLLIYVANGLTMIRIYARIFLGPHIKTYHTQARQSS